MSLATLTTANLESLIALVKKRDAIQAELAKIEGQIQSAFSAPTPVKAPATTAKVKTAKTRVKRKKTRVAPVAKVAPKPVVTVGPAAKPVKKGKRGALKESVLGALKAAGTKGISVKNLSTKLGVKNQNLHVWFSTTGKNVKGLKKTGTGTWSYAG